MRTCLLACVLLLVTATAAFPAVTSESFAGDWEGTLDKFGLRVVLHLVHAGGKWTATMDSPDQGGYGIPCDEVKIDGMKLYLAIDAVNMEFDGKLSKDGNSIEGMFAQGERVPLTLVRSGEAPVAPAAPAVTPQPFAGDWAGAVDAGGMRLPILIHLTLKNGSWSGTMDSPDQGSYGIPFTSVVVEGTMLRLEAKSIGGQYRGDLAADSQTIKGTWSQSGMSLALDLQRGDASSLPVPKRPQEPKPPFQYHSEDVSVPVQLGATLAGTLTIPQGKGPFPAVLLISGSGPQDRDETIAGHRPFFVLADHLTRNGIAVLRVDDRGVGKSKGTFKDATTNDFANDAVAAVRFLKAREDITSVGLLGHSEGGIVAPIAATRFGVSFIVLMAAPGLPLDRILARQMEDIQKANGVPSPAIAVQVKANRRLCAIARDEEDWTQLRPKLQAVGDTLYAELAAMDPAVAAAGRQSLDSSIQTAESLWFRSLLRLVPADILRNVKVPVLAINGSLDLQVSAKENLPAIEQALRGGGNRDVTVKEMPGLNHLFQTATTGSPTEYATIEETFSPTAMTVISDWILARTGAKQK